MLKLGKRKLHLKKARGAKKVHCTNGESGEHQLQPQRAPSAEEQSTANHSLLSEDEIPSSDSDTDTDFDPEEALQCDPDAMLNEFCADWIASLTRDDQYSLALLLFSSGV